MIYVYIAAIVFVAFCIVMYFVLVAKKHEETLAKFKNEKNLKSVDVTEKKTDKQEELKQEKSSHKDEKLQDYVFEKSEKQAEQSEEKIDLSQIDFEALENMSDEEFDRTLNGYSPELRDAVLDELLKRNDDEE